MNNSADLAYLGSSLRRATGMKVVTLICGEMIHT